MRPCTFAHGAASIYQGPIGELRKGGVGDAALAVDLGVAHQQMRAGNAYVRELDPAVVDAVAAHLGPVVADGHARTQCERLWIAQLHHKRFHPVVLAIDQHHCVDHTTRHINAAHYQWVADSAAPPIHHFDAVNVGV